MANTAIDGYIRRIKNANKRRYAIAYAEFLKSGGDEPERHPLSYMAAQAVRMALTELSDSYFRGGFNKAARELADQGL